jgi:xanthine dehydrogenase YagS FAD-binding subunit
MKRFDYSRPASLFEAIDAVSAPNAAFLGGGTNLLDLMKMNVVRPDRLVDVTHLPDLDRIEWLDDGSVRIGALVRNSDLAFDPAFAKAFPAVAEAILSGASPQLRNMATTGGNLMQKTRCAYYWDVASPCNRRDGAGGCAAIGGENRNHAILGWSEACIAKHPSDFAVPLAAFDAVVEIAGKSGRREVAVGDFHRLPGDTPNIETALQPGEIIVAVRLPAEARRFARHARYLKLRERTSYAFALVSVAAGLVIENGTISAARLALGGVAAKPWRSQEAEAALVGKPANAASFKAAADILLDDARPSGDNAFKIDLARRLIVRACREAAHGTPDRVPALPGSVLATQIGDLAHV